MKIFIQISGVTGPSSDLNREIQLITRFLRGVGYNVELHNNFETLSGASTQELLNMVAQDKDNVDVVVTAQHIPHIPWGG